MLTASKYAQPDLLLCTQKHVHRVGMQVGHTAQSMPRAAWMLGLGVIVLSGLLPMDVMAELPTAADEVVPDGVGGEGVDPMTQGARIMQLVFQVICGGLGLLALVVPIGSIIKSYRTRKNGDNDEFHGTVVGGLAVMVLGLGLAILGFGFAGGLADQVMALGGGGGA